MGSTSWFIQSGAAKTAIAGAKRRLQRCVNYRLGPNPTAFGGVAPSHDLSDRVMMLKPLVLAAGIALVTSTAGRTRCSWCGSLHGGKKHDAKNELPAEQRRLSPEIDFKKKASDSQQKVDAASREIDDLKSAVAILQKSVSQLQAAEKERK
jgi:uncharacterized Zn finger protein (UPF0148 family)